ncbi:MAG: hypothetical protein D6B27_06475 [Gammaproteobacteria bacterium]|nr:MAG: hypothetical protein D6B27_06475 [Gammaproteobacteria bacterium]
MPTNDEYLNELWAFDNTGSNNQDEYSDATVGADIELFSAWKIEDGSSNEVIVAVLDDGNGYIDDVNGYDFADQDNNPNPMEHHGTHISGTIAGVANNGIGVVGVSQYAKLMAIKTWSDEDDSSTAATVEGLTYAVDNGARVVNMSLSVLDSQSLQDAIEYANEEGY